MFMPFRLRLSLILPMIPGFPLNRTLVLMNTSLLTACDVSSLLTVIWWIWLKSSLFFRFGYIEDYAVGVIDKPKAWMLFDFSII